MVAPRLPWIECLVSSRPYPVESIDEMRVSMAITRLTFGGFAATPESLNLSLAITAAGLSANCATRFSPPPGCATWA
jgi:hypothetical protein